LSQRSRDMTANRQAIIGAKELLKTLTAYFRYLLVSSFKEYSLAIFACSG